MAKKLTRAERKAQAIKTAAEQKRQRGGYYLELESCSGCIDRVEVNAMLNSISGIERK